MAFAGNNYVNKIEKLNWDGIEVVYLEDGRFPIYNIDIQFSDGALSDRRGRSGETSLMFDFLEAGTTGYSQRELNDYLEFLGLEYGAFVTHEYSSYVISGPIKTVIPSLKMICHMFSNANFPTKVFKKDIYRLQNSLQNLVNNPKALADRVFREISMQNTPYVRPTGGKLVSLKRLKGKDFLIRGFAASEVLPHFAPAVEMVIMVILGTCNTLGFDICPDSAITVAAIFKLNPEYGGIL